MLAPDARVFRGLDAPTGRWTLWWCGGSMPGVAFTLTIRTRGEAFEDASDADKALREIARLLRGVVVQVLDGWSERNIVDSNGDICGQWEWS
jgi:hypothetical protein